MAILLSTIAVAILAVGSFIKVPAWKSRGFDARDIKWTLLICISTFVGIGLGVFAYLGSSNPWTSMTVAIGGYLLAFSSTVDVLLLKIPSEPTKLAGFLGAIAFLFAIPTLLPESYVSLLMWGAWITIFGVLSMMGWLGDADMQLFKTFFFLYAWWIPPNQIILILFVMVIFGFVTSGLARVFKIGVSKKVHESTTWNAEKGRIESLPDDEATSEPLVINEQLENPDAAEFSKKSHKAKKKKKEKYFFPFGPAIIASTVSVAIYASFAAEIIPSFSLF